MMRIERKTYRDGNLYPEVFNYLKSIPDEFVFSSNYGERHPFSIYSLSIQRLLEGLNEILDEIDKISIELFKKKENYDYSILKNLPKLQQELLYSLQSHIDDCYLIFKVLHPSDVSKEYSYVETWLEKTKHPTYTHFRTNIKAYKDSLSPIINKIKHNGGRLRPIIMYSTKNDILVQDKKSRLKYPVKNLFIPGYFLEGVLPDGTIGPDHKIHDGGNTAISLNYDLRFHFANFYRIGRYLKRSIIKAIHLTHGIELPYPKAYETNNSYENIEQIAQRISKLPKLFFRNEFSKKTPDILYYKDTESSELILDFQGIQNIIWHGSVNIQGTGQVDRISLSYKIPYLGTK